MSKTTGYDLGAPRETGWLQGQQGRRFRVAIPVATPAPAGSIAFDATAPVLMLRKAAGNVVQMGLKDVTLRVASASVNPVGLVIVRDTVDRLVAGTGTPTAIHNTNGNFVPASAITAALIRPTATAPGATEVEIYRDLVPAGIGQGVALDFTGAEFLAGVGCYLFYAFDTAALAAPDLLPYPEWEEAN